MDIKTVIKENLIWGVIGGAISYFGFLFAIFGGKLATIPIYIFMVPQMYILNAFGFVDPTTFISIILRVGLSFLTGIYLAYFIKKAINK